MPIDRTRCFVVALVSSCAMATAIAQERYPLEPPDRSSPRAALKTFLASADATGAYLVGRYLPSPSRENFEHLAARAKVAIEAVDASMLPPAGRSKAARAASLALYEVLNRIELPPWEQVPDAAQINLLSGTGAARWVIPHTEIVLERAEKGPRAGEFLFSARTVGRASEFYERVRTLPLRRRVPVQNLHAIVVQGGAWMIPPVWVQALPRWTHRSIGEQAIWKWLALAAVLLLFAILLRLVYRLSHLGSERRPFLQALAQFAMPAFVLAATPVVAYFVLVQINLIGHVGVLVDLAATAVIYLAWAWLLWRLAPVVAEAMIASPHIAPESVDAHLIRVTARLLGIVGAAALLALGADRLGVPVYGIVAGLGVGGLAIALAAQPTIENLIGGMNLFADKPIRVGDLCRYGDELGIVEGIGIRSSRIRGIDRTLTTIPNAALAKMPIVNLTHRDQMLVREVLGLRYETTPEQLRYLLVRIRELLHGHPRVSPDPARARFAGFGASSLNIELFAYVTTRDWNEFLAIREDLLLRVMEIIEQAGTAIAFPSQTIYLGRDSAADEAKVSAAEASVQAWRAEGALPFPNFSPEQASRLRGGVAYPPPGSPAAEGPTEGKSKPPA